MYYNVCIGVIYLGINEDNMFTTGEFASISGVTLRALRYYDKIGLLKPSSYNSLGHRLYSTQDFARLQKVLTLKFIGLSLEEISNIIKYDINDRDFKKSLEIQKEIMQQKINHIKMVIKAIDETYDMLNNDNILNWDKFIKIINVLNKDTKWMEQYENASNLRARIKMHELYSTNELGWMPWFFNQLHIPENSNILELGCGVGTLWIKNFKKIPPGWKITLTDFSEGMLKDAKRNLGKKLERFYFKIVDAQSIPYDDLTFDVVIANHMLYHVSDIDKALAEISRVLKPGGHFYASTVGKKHMSEMRDINNIFQCEDLTFESFEATEKFQLENGKVQVSKWFKQVKIKRYEDSLYVTKPEPLIDYIFSIPDNVKEKIDVKKVEKLQSLLQNEINKNGGIHITKDTGFFEGIK